MEPPNNNDNNNNNNTTTTKTTITTATAIPIPITTRTRTTTTITTATTTTVTVMFFRGIPWQIAFPGKFLTITVLSKSKFSKRDFKGFFRALENENENEISQEFQEYPDNSHGNNKKFKETSNTFAASASPSPLFFQSIWK